MMKGKTTIELTDVNTGETERIEETNMVTNALQYIFKPIGFLKEISQMYESGFINAYATVTGGLLLLDTAIEEDAENYILPHDVNQTGSAAFNAQNTSGQTVRGNYNATESVIDPVNKTVKYVYDFDTAEGNGRIACVALTRRENAYTTRGVETIPTRETQKFFTPVASTGPKLTGNNSGISGYDRTYSYLAYGTGIRWLYRIDGENDIAYYFTITSTTSIAIRGYRANITSLNYFDNPLTRRVLVSEETISFGTAINQQYFSYNYSVEENKLYIMSASNYSVSNNGAYTITEIDFGNENAVHQYAMTNKSGVSIRLAYDKNNALCYKGYIYFESYSASSSTYSLFRQKIGTSADIQKVTADFNIRQVAPVMGRDGFVIFEMASSYSGSMATYLLDTETFKLRVPETEILYGTTQRDYHVVEGIPLLYYISSGSTDGSYALRNDYLATINNLETPVTKTAAKTMKVTYTLTEN